MTERDQIRSALSELLAEAPLREPLAAAQLDRLADFGAAVLAQNRVMNLTAVTEPEAFARLHLLDSLTLLNTAELAGRSVLDVGTGGGFPGVPLKIACPTMALTLLDSTAKKIAWLAQTLPALGVEAQAVSARAEEFTEQYDVVTSRAVARLQALCELCLPHVRVGGCFYAMKGPDGDAEAAEAANAIRILGGGDAELTHLTLPGGERRVIVAVHKLRETPAGYPRPWGQIKKRPL